jgi:AcrR family transcriptional regulator
MSAIPWPHSPNCGAWFATASGLPSSSGRIHSRRLLDAFESSRNGFARTRGPAFSANESSCGWRPRHLDSFASPPGPVVSTAMNAIFNRETRREPDHQWHVPTAGSGGQPVLYQLMETVDRVPGMAIRAERVPGSRAVSTEQRLVRAAERLFAEHGIGAVSLRTVMHTAGTNVAAIHYHFGSKEGLLDAVLRSRLDQVSGERNAVLAELSGTAVTAHGLARAFVQPVVAVLDSGGEHWIRLVGQLLATGDAGLDAISGSFLQRNAMFVELLERLSPGVARQTLNFRLTLAMNVTLNVLGDVERTRRLQDRDATTWTTGEVIADLVDVVASVLVGPPAPGT